MRYTLAATYLLAMALVSYFVSDTARAGEGFWDSWTFFVLYVAAHAAVGFAIGRWWALLLIPAAAVVAVPAGYPAQGEVPAATEIVIIATWMLAPAMVSGIGGRKVVGVLLSREVGSS
jgi:hypothetical protein